MHEYEEDLDDFEADEAFQLDFYFEKKVGSITQMVVGNTSFLYVLKDQTDAWEVNLWTEARGDRKLLGPRTDELHKVFIDPSGTQAWISLKSSENFYFRNEKNVKTNLPGMKMIDAVGWDKSGKSNSMLVGDTEGKIYEVRPDSKSGQMKLSLLHELRERRKPVNCDIEVEKVNDGYHAIITYTHDHGCAALAQFRGSSFSTMFNVDPGQTRHMPGESRDLRIYRTAVDEPLAFAWTTVRDSRVCGFLHGKIDLKKDMKRQDTVLYSEDALPFDPVDLSVTDHLRDIVISEHHILLLYPNRLQVVAHPPGMNWSEGKDRSKKVLSKEELERRTVWTHSLNAGELNEGQRIIQDPSNGKLYVHSKSAVFELVYYADAGWATWKCFLERGMSDTTNDSDREAYFRAALDMFHDDSAKTARVHAAIGDYYFEIGDYSKASKVYSLTTKSFEQVAVKYIKNNNPDALLELVRCRLQFMQKRVLDLRQEQTQLYCLCTWVVQLYLAQLNQAPDEDTHEEIQYQFREFIEQNMDYLDKGTICELIASLANPEELLYFVELSKDYRRVIAQYVTHNKPQKALECLTTRCNSKEYEEVWYQFSPRLIQHAPVALVSGWMNESKGPSFLKPPRLIPALMKYEVKYNPPGNTKNQAIRYLQWLIGEKRNKDPAIHNMLLSLFAKQPDESGLLEFLNTHTDNYYYDLNYALRLCLAENKYKASIHIYSALSLYEDAVALALSTGNIHLAKLEAKKPHENEARKRLWRNIAQHVVKHEDEGVKKAIAMLKECPLQLEDILPFFPDFTLIQDFKSEICECLVGYTDRLKELKDAMDRQYRNENVIRQHAAEHDLDSCYVSETTRCGLCSNFVLSSNFLMFPSCNHAFHFKCLVAYGRTNFEPKLRDKLLKYEKMGDEDKVTEIVSQECPFCGYRQISETKLPFDLGEL